MADEYTQHISNRLQLDSFELFPARTPSHPIRFLEDGKAEGGGYTGWALFWDQRRANMQIRLHKGAQLQTWLWLKKDGVWSGQDRSRGMCELRVDEQHSHMWKNLDDKRKFSTEPVSREIPKAFAYFDEAVPDFDWSQHYVDLEKPEGIPDNKTAIAFVCADRLDYATKVFSAIAENTNIENYPVYCFIDKSETESLHGEQDKHEAMILERIPHAVCLKRPVNFGCGRNIIDTRRQVFDVLGYERMMLFEDDCIPDKSVVALTENLMDWAESNYDNVGIVQTWAREWTPKEKKNRRTVRIMSTDDLWMYMQTKKSWDASREFIMTYQDLFLKGMRYGHRPHTAITHWKKMQTDKPRKIVPGRAYPLTTRELGSLWEGLNIDVGGCQDQMTKAALFINGYERIGTTATRGYYIGESGIHCNPAFYQQRRLGEIYPVNNGHDAKLKNFVLERDFDKEQ